MSADREKVEPKTDLELGLNYSDQCIQSSINNDSGAGANAASIVDMTFVATGRLPELVWSADKGLSLKCADSSFANKNASFFRDVGPSNIIPDPPQGGIFGESTGEKPIDDVSIKPIAAVCIASDIVGTDTLAGHPANDTAVLLECKAVEERNTGASVNMEEMGTAERVSNLQTDLRENLTNWVEIKICDQVNTGTAEVSQMKCTKSSMNLDLASKRSFDNLSLRVDEPKLAMDRYSVPRAYTSGGIDIGKGNQAVETNDVMCFKVDPAIEYKGLGPPGTNLTSSGRSPFEKLESTAENDLITFNCDAACGATNANLVAQSNDIENKAQNVEMMPIGEKNLSVVHSPSNSRIHMLSNKGKEKALSEGDLNVRLSVEKEDSHESVESCNSAGLFSTSKKRLNFQQQLIVGSKRVKRQTQETSCSKSFVKQDSSFMNWISNMMKGFSQSIQDEANCLPLTLGHSDHSYQRPDQNLLTYNKNQDPEPKITGFHSIFQSMYCPGMKSAGMGILDGDNLAGEGSKGLESGDKVHGIDAIPITCCAKNESLCKQYNQSNEMEGSTWRYESGPSSQPEIEPVNLLNSHESSKIDSTENKNYCNTGVGKEKEGIPSNSSSGRQNTCNNENIESCAVSESKAADNIYRKSDALRSLWITRFSAKSNAPLKVFDHLNQSGKTHVHSHECSKLPGSPHFLKDVAYLKKCKLEENKEQSTDDRMLIEAKGLQTSSTNKDSSSGPKDTKFNNDLDSMHKLNPVSPSSRFRNSEPMASMFARRLDAIKHLIPSQANVTCLFCGTRGHQLRNCSEISGNELEELLKNLNSYGGLEELPCLCIKCFQPNHWAIACPSSFPKGQHELEVNAVVNECCPGGVQFSAGVEETARLITAEEDQLFSVAATSDGVDTRAERSLSLKHKASEVMMSEMVGSIASVKKQFTCSNEDKQNENPMIFPSSIERQISDVPKRIFDVVRKLRLSRTNILKWMDSHITISHLEGFFLRLRLGKWEEGLGGTGYYVASINEARRQSSQQNARISLSVNVGGIRCMVESQYISNQEFLEEEIMAWWCTTTKAGGNIPSEKDLIEKINKKKMLGF